MQQLFKNKVVAIDVLIESDKIQGFSLVCKDQAVFFSENLDIVSLLKESKAVICFNQGHLKKYIPGFNCKHDLMSLYFQLNPEIKFNKDLDFIIKHEYFSYFNDKAVFLKKHPKAKDSLTRASFILKYYKTNYKRAIKSILKLDNHLISTFNQPTNIKIDSTSLRVELSFYNKLQWDCERFMWNKVGHPFKQIFQLNKKLQKDKELLNCWNLRNKAKSKYSSLIRYLDNYDLQIDLDFCGSSTGRIICRDQLGLFTPDNDYKSLFISNPGYTFISCDYSKQEATIIASVSGDSRLQRDLSKPRFYELLSKKYLNKANKELGKILFYSLIYGSSAKSISKKLNLELEDSYDLIEELSNRYTDMIKWLKKAPRLKYNYYNRPLYTNTANAYIQSTAADLVRYKLLETQKYNPILVFSDNIIYSVKDSLVENYSLEIKDILEKHPDFKLGVVLTTSKNLKF